MFINLKKNNSNFVVIHNPTEGWVIFEASVEAACYAVASKLNTPAPEFGDDFEEWLVALTGIYPVTIQIF